MLARDLYQPAARSGFRIAARVDTGIQQRDRANPIRCLPNDLQGHATSHRVPCQQKITRNLLQDMAGHIRDGGEAAKGQYFYIGFFVNLTGCIDPDGLIAQQPRE